ncbi:Type II secretion system F domain-containing protein [Burkholderia sp. lig30]|jgi:tight adherence protein C|uniref:type II secretion system F family protein n=1 Tax=Burkholderia sp. lig30 TaxID=1192124 RepID=UPI0004619DD8|nr:type II secretion system F family protein [Burkholderia sp. lig30]KDB08368.1 Type II secretion system F domain-containing protein [Burkholderia sp. lig30]
MNTADMTIDAALFGLLAVGLAWFVRRATGARQRIAQRVRHGVARAAAEDAAGDAAGNMPQRVARRVASLGERVPVVDASQRMKLAARLASAGFRERRAVSVMAGLKVVGGACLAFGAIAAGAHLPRVGEYVVFRVLFMAAAFVIGMMLPEHALGIVVSRRQKTIAAYLPDALDLLVICTNAGNSLVVAIKRVSAEMQSICPPLSDEFSVAADEMQFGADSAGALNAMAARIGLPSMRALVTTLVQSQQYGTPITQSLRVLSRTERSTQIIALEEKAAKLAAKMTLPMMLFVMPTVALIAAGPAVIRLIAVFRK